MKGKKLHQRKTTAFSSPDPSLGSRVGSGFENGTTEKIPARQKFSRPFTHHFFVRKSIAPSVLLFLLDSVFVVSVSPKGRGIENVTNNKENADQSEANQAKRKQSAQTVKIDNKVYGLYKPFPSCNRNQCSVFLRQNNKWIKLDGCLYALHIKLNKPN